MKEPMSLDVEQYRKRSCRYSGEPLGAPFLELGTMPLANSYVKPQEAEKEEFRCPLSLVFAPTSGLVQLSHVVPPDLMFKNYLYVSSTTKTFQAHFSEYAKTIHTKLGFRGKPSKGALAVDIGSNDGALLALYLKAGLRAVGVDPATNLAEEANRKGLKTVNRYFDEKAVHQILAQEGKASVISANNVFAHIDDVHSVCRNVSELLDDTGFFVTEFPYLGVMLEKLYFDMIYHEHLSYIALKPLAYLLQKFDLQIFDVQFVDSHGGSLRVFIKKKRASYPVAEIVGKMLQEEEKKGYFDLVAYQNFSKKVMKVTNDLVTCIQNLKQKGKSIAGYGAPAKASTIINFCGFTTHEIDYVVDDNPMKQNHLVPGAKIPIVPSSYLQSEPKDYIVIFAWNFAKEILGKIGHLKNQGVRFIVPLLKPEKQEQSYEEQPSYQLIS